LCNGLAATVAAIVALAMIDPRHAHQPLTTGILARYRWDLARQAVDTLIEPPQSSASPSMTSSAPIASRTCQGAERLGAGPQTSASALGRAIAWRRSFEQATRAVRSYPAR
jgi:hypothetical protein